MSVKLSPFGPKPAFWDSNGNPLSGGKLYFFAAGSTTSQNTYTDSTGGSANTNPVVLNSRGEPPNEIWFTTGLTYKAVLKTSADVTIWSVDNISAINDVSAATADEWLSPGLTPTFISTTSFSLAGDQTTEFHIGRRLKTTNTAGTIYSTITNSVFGALTTVTVTNDSGNLDSGLSAVSYGILRSTNPSVARLNGALTLTGALTVNGNATLGDAASDTTIINGNTFIGDTTNAKQTLGLTINQGANDDAALELKSSDVAHGVTGEAETDTYLSLKKASANSGGTMVETFTEDVVSCWILGVHTNDNSTRSTAADAPIKLNAGKKSGTGFGASAADTNGVVIQFGGSVRQIFDSDGDSHQDVGTAWTNFDDGDDIARLDAVAVSLAREGDPLREQFVQHFEAQRAVIEAMPGKPLVTFNEDGHHFVNMSRLTMLLTGAVRQLARENRELRAMMLALEAK